MISLRLSLTLLVLAGAAIGSYSLSGHVQSKAKRVAELRRSWDSEQERLETLKTELDFVTRGFRLQALNDTHFGLVPPTPDQYVKTLSDLAALGGSGAAENRRSDRPKPRPVPAARGQQRGTPPVLSLSQPDWRQLTSAKTVVGGSLVSRQSSLASVALPKPRLRPGQSAARPASSMGDVIAAVEALRQANLQPSGSPLARGGDL